jgi:hypothetical protein
LGGSRLDTGQNKVHTMNKVFLKTVSMIVSPFSYFVSTE